MQQAVLSRPAAAPAVPQLAPPHWVHSRGQQALPLSFSPSKPGNPLLHSEAGSVLVFWRSRRGRRATWSPQIVFNIQKTWYKFGTICLPVYTGNYVRMRRLAESPFGNSSRTSPQFPQTHDVARTTCGFLCGVLVAGTNFLHRISSEFLGQCCETLLAHVCAQLHVRGNMAPPLIGGNIRPTVVLQNSSNGSPCTGLGVAGAGVVGAGVEGAVVVGAGVSTVKHVSEE